MLCQWPVTFHYPMYVVTCFHMVLHMTIADSCRYPVLWMSLDRLVGSATSICVVLISLLFASVSYALLRFDQMHRATLELSLASEAICSQAPHQSQIWQTCEIDGNRGTGKPWKTIQKSAVSACPLPDYQRVLQCIGQTFLATHRVTLCPKISFIVSNYPNHALNP